MKSSTQIGLGVLATALVVGGFAFVARSAVPLQADDPAGPERSDVPHGQAGAAPKAPSVRLPRRPASNTAKAPTHAPTTISNAQAAPNTGGIATTGTGSRLDTIRTGIASCFCGVDTENRSFCFDDLFCTNVTACASSSDCPVGSRCVADNCCPAPRDFGCFPECRNTLSCTGGGTCLSGYSPCENDVCADAVLLPVPGTATGDTTGATVDAAPFCNTVNVGPGVWYKVIGTGNTITASTCSEFNSNPDTKISVYCLSCSTLECAAGNDDNCIAWSSLLSTVSWCSRAGAEYLILVHDFSTTSGSGAFTLNVWDDGVTCGNPPCPQGCTAVAAVDCGANVNGDTSPYASAVDLYNCIGWDESGPDVAYSFTPSTDSHVTAALSGLSSDLDVFILDQRCDASACIAFGDSTATFDATGGTTYYIVVDGFQGASGPFKLTVTCPQPVCAPTTDGLDCEPVACPTTADVCLSTQVSSLAGWQVLDCACMSDNACHVVMNPDALPSVGCVGSGCSSDQGCTLIGTDTNADGTDDTFECRCEPLPCEQSGFPACGGTCPAGSACVPDDVAALCACRTAKSQACCLPDGSCANETAEVCRTRGGTPEGLGTVCGAFACPAVEVDVFPFSIGTIEFEYPSGFRETIAVHGPAEARVYFDGPVQGSANDDDGNVLDEVATEMTQLELAGTSLLLGPVVIRLNPALRSMGVIEETTDNTPGTLDVPPFAPTGTASSFFDLYLQIDLQKPGIQLFTLDPKRMRATIAHKPPAPGTLYENANRIELFDAQGNPTGYFLDSGSHQPRPVCKLGDTNDDGGWNLDDFAGFLSCFHGPAGGPPSDDCIRCFDYDTDEDVDVGDFGSFQRIYDAQPQP